MRQATIAFYANRMMLCDVNVSINARPLYFETAMSSMGCFGVEYRTVRQEDLHILNVEREKRFRSIVVPAGTISWDQPWPQVHDI